MSVVGNTTSEKHRKTTSNDINRNMRIDLKHFLLILVSSATLSFLAGRLAKQYFNINERLDKSVPVVHPSLSLHDGKIPPKHKYSGVQFDSSESNGRVVNTHLPSVFNTSDEVCTVSVDGKKQCIIDNTKDVNHIDGNAEGGKANSEIGDADDDDDDDDDDEYDEDDHLPAGQHLLIDIKNVDSDFLNSDVRLAKAMVDVVNLSKLTLLSYHCHNLIPQGISCVGVLLESHISFHTWPEAGVITLDLFTCGSGKLVPLVPIVESLFAIQQVGSLVKPIVKWVHKLRGFRPEDYDDVLVRDLGSMLASPITDGIEEIATVQTKFQRIDVFDLREDYNRTDPEFIAYREKNKEMYKPQRIVFLDGVIQSTRNDMEAYHEALVHPAMFTHSDPKRVAIIGGGEATTLKEVLKHNTLEKVTMIEIDEEMVHSSRMHLPEWSDCSDIIGSEEWCGDDSRAELFYEDALAWFLDRFSKEGKLFDEGNTKFDLIIMDALDPQDDISFAELLYTDETFISSLYNALNDNGIIVFQLGEAPDATHHHDSMNANSRRAILTEKLEEAGFESFHVYEDGNCGFWYPWTFLVVMKDKEDAASWYRNEAETDVAIHQRIKRTKSGDPVLKYFDGALMTSYQMPHKVFQTTFCRRDPTPVECTIQEGKIEDLPESNLEVKLSSIGDGSGRGVYTKVDIKKGMSVGREVTVHPVYFPPPTTELIVHYSDMVDSIDDVYNYMDGYGWDADTMGKQSYYVDASIQTFINHGCNGTYNVGGSLLKLEQSITEQNATESDYDSYSGDEGLYEYSPHKSRHIHRISTTPELALKDINAGDELFTDYLDLSVGNEWWEEVEELKRMCNGEGVGLIEQTEKRHLEENSN